MDDSSKNSGQRSMNQGVYANKGRVMMVSVVILCASILIIAGFHIYTRWVLDRRRRPRHHFRPRAAAVDVSAMANSSFMDRGKGLNLTVLRALPTFLYSSTTARDDQELAESPECAVCLSGFEDGEAVRVLPSCKHSFHLGCIDLWFRSHSNCPLCRVPVQNPDGTLVIKPDSVGAGSLLPVVWCSIVRDPKLPELTSIRVDTIATGDAQGSRPAPVTFHLSNGLYGPPESK